MNDYDWILYPGSPFMPSVVPNSLKNIEELVRIRRLKIGHAVATEVGLVGAALHELHESMFLDLEFTWGIDKFNLTHYFFGFTTPAALIQGANLSETKHLSEVYKAICLSAKDDLLIRLNTYKAFHLLYAIETFQALRDRPPVIFSETIINRLKEIPFVPDIYFLIGLEAGRLLHTDLLRAMHTK